MRFHRKIAFITGGATGLGRAFARALTGEGRAWQSPTSTALPRIAPPPN
ncbi:hypothetical protein I553_8451 [Mycobacterium xenopi 4042]|uniref:Short chain dehydrogenase family protein n=1 Tax=Mycobacterium xenopi 4042 TaxID=1299334 RepID=X8CLS5_MYCXE|nr:hypothetical protein I553_8451 [Mycobacterium xenopi 4042]